MRQVTEDPTSGFIFICKANVVNTQTFMLYRKSMPRYKSKLVEIICLHGIDHSINSCCTALFIALLNEVFEVKQASLSSHTSFSFTVLLDVAGLLGVKGLRGKGHSFNNFILF
jgi:hypothetical protein